MVTPLGNIPVGKGKEAQRGPFETHQQKLVWTGWGILHFKEW